MVISNALPKGFRSREMMALRYILSVTYGIMPWIARRKPSTAQVPSSVLVIT